MKKKIQAGRPYKKAKVNKIDIRIGYASCAAAEISGDAVISCGLPGGSRALILSDGMGKGIKAAAGSRLVVSRLRRNLREGMPAPAAIREVNRYMIAQDGSEEFATVDMAIIDPASCRASFYKMGAATSYLVRRGKVRLIEKEALPVGIIPKLKMPHVSAGLKAGDILIIVSDGITDADRQDFKAHWLADYLTELADAAQNKGSMTMGPRQLAAEILAMARSRYGSRERDDLTVAAVMIEDSGSDT